MPKSKFPKQIFVTRENDGGGGAEAIYLAATENMDDAIEQAGHGNDVAVYELKVVRRAEIKRQLG